MIRFRNPARPSCTALTVFTVAYVGLLMTFLIALRIYHAISGPDAVVSLIFVTKMSDTGAYFVGRSLAVIR